MKVYQAVEAVPSRVVAVLRLLHESDGKRRPADVLPELMQPRSVRSREHADTLVANSLQLLRQLSSGTLRLIEEIEDEDGRVHVWLGESLRSGGKRRFDDLVWQVLADVTLGPSIGSQANEFAEFCAWLMWQSAQTMPQTHLNLKSRIETDGLSCDELGLNSDARWDVAIYWAQYLGLIWQWKDVKCDGLVPDPTDYLSRVLEDVLPSTAAVTIRDFVDTLGRRCPVLDGGAVHASVGQRIQATRGTDRPGDQLSPALSLAIRALADVGTVRHWCPDDQRDFALLADGAKIAFIQRAKYRARG